MKLCDFDKIARASGPRISKYPFPESTAILGSNLFWRELRREPESVSLRAQRDKLSHHLREISRQVGTIEPSRGVRFDDFDEIAIAFGATYF